ncbi:MAG: hypothetical protein E7317_05280 [Clostridiales bacterium]|nr:hypothetical protein [Clostridiales bacterium]
MKSSFVFFRRSTAVRRTIIALFSLVLLIGLGRDSYAYTDYDTLKSQHEGLERSYIRCAKDVENIQKYLDAARSGDKEKWEKARKNLPTVLMTEIRGSLDEVGLVEERLHTYKLLMYYSYAELLNNETKQEVYFDYVISKERSSLDIAGDNGYPICPSGADNIWFLVARTDLEKDIEDIDKDPWSYSGLVYLLTGKITDVDASVYMLDCNGRTVSVSIPDEDGIDHTMPPVGEYVNVFATFMLGRSDSLLQFSAYGLEENTDSSRLMRFVHSMELADEEQG